MPNLQVVVVDTNILFSALLKNSSSFSQILLQKNLRFIINELVLVELFKYKEKIVRMSRLSEEEVVQFLYRLMRCIEFYKEDLVSDSNRRIAYELCRDIDPKDTPHVAITIELNGLLWTGDKALKKGLKEKGFNRFYDPSDSPPFS